MHRSFIIQAGVFAILFAITVAMASKENSTFPSVGVTLGARGGHQEDLTITIPLTLEASGSHFVGPVRIGGTDYQVAFSFMASSIWIFGNDAKKQTKNDGFPHKLYDKDVDAGNLLLAKYLDGSTYIGRQVEEKVEIKGVTIFKKRSVGIMKLKMETKTRTDTWATRMDGVFGLGLRSMEAEPTGVSAVQQIASSSPMASCKMSLHLEKDGKEGELRIGTNSVVPAHFCSPLTYVPVVEPLAGWTVELGAFRMGEEKLAENQPIEVNLGSNAIWAPKSVIEDIIKTTKGEATWDKTTHGVTIDCTKRDGLPTLTFEFNHVSHDFTPEEYFPEFIVPGYTMKERKCTLFVMPTESLPYGESLSLQQRWSLGVPFFKKFYTVYDAEDEQAHQYRVGFALAKHA